MIFKISAIVMYNFKMHYLFILYNALYICVCMYVSVYIPLCVCVCVCVNKFLELMFILLLGYN